MSLSTQSNHHMSIVTRINRKESMNYFRLLTRCIIEANRLHLNNNIISKIEKKNSKWHREVIVNNVCGRTFKVHFIVEYDNPKNSVYIKIIRWEENDKVMENFTGFTSCDNSLGTCFCLSHSKLCTNAPKTIYPFERENSRENLVTEKVFGIDDMGFGEEVYMPVRLSDRVRDNYTITLPSGTVIRVNESDIKDTCFRVIKRKPVKK